MKSPPKGSDVAMLRKIEKQYTKARIDYAGYFLSAYIAYNAWYYQVTGTTNDRQALTILKRRYVLWSDYCNGTAMRGLLPYMQQLSELTQREPFESAVSHWNGEVTHSTDWRSLIEYWYQVRCALVHGTEVGEAYIWLAYHTLDIFMEEIIQRMRTCSKQTKQPEGAASFDSARKSIWHVDMHYV